MTSFRQQTARRIAIVSLSLAAIAAPVAGFLVSEQAEEATVKLAMEESRRMVVHYGATSAMDVSSTPFVQKAADALIGGMFDIAEIYSPDGKKLVEAMTPDGTSIESALPKHGRPSYQRADYERLDLADGRAVMRIFVPLRMPSEASTEGAITGYFEGVRIIPEWQIEQVRHGMWSAALVVGLAALLCGAVIYPVVVHLSADNERKAREVLESHISIMEALGRAIARRDSDTGAHNYRVAWIAARIARQFGQQASAMQALIIGSFLHDVGKIGIPDAILLKPGRLTDDEMQIMRTHVDLGGEIVRGIGWLEQACLVVLGHHEKWDGSGYPNGQAGDAIPLAARIFAVADVFDALTSQRPYKAAFDFDTAISIIARDTGAHFDPAVVAAFLKIAPAIHEQLLRSDETACRHLLAEEIRCHFGL